MRIDTVFLLFFKNVHFRQIIKNMVEFTSNIHLASKILKPRIPITIFFLIVLTPIFGQELWSEFLERNKSRAPLDRSWVLLVQKDVLESLPESQWTNNPVFSQMRRGRDIVLIELDPAETKDFWKLRGWNDEPHWILCNRYNGDHTIGKGFPTSDEIVGIMVQSNYVPFIEKVEKFLKLHPDTSPASEINIFHTMGLVARQFSNAVNDGRAIRHEPPAANSRNIGGVLNDTEVADEVYAEFCTALQRFSEVPDWWRINFLFWEIWAPYLRLYDAAKSTHMSLILRQMKHDLVREWERSPNDPSINFGMMWYDISMALGEKLDIPQISPCPDDIFPSWAFVVHVCEELLRIDQFDKIPILLDTVLLQLPQAKSVFAWQKYVELMQNIWYYNSMAFAALGKNKKCLEALDNAKYWYGDSWSKEDNVAQEIISAFPKLFTDEELLINDILNSDRTENPIPPPLQQLLRIIVFDNARWLPQLHQTACYWTAEELYMGPGTGDDMALLGDVMEARAGWAFLRGSVLVNHGFGLENLKTALELELSQQASKYQQLTQYIARHPQTIEGREKRYKLSRLLYGKDALLEENINDALLSNTPIEFDPGVEYSDAIRNNVIRHINRLRQIIYRHPYSYQLLSEQLPPNIPHQLWETLLSWNRIANIKNLVTGMIDEINFFDEPVVWMPQLPKAVHAEVIREYKAANSVNDVKDWLKTTLEGIERLKVRKFDYDKELLDMINELLKIQEVQ